MSGLGCCVRVVVRVAGQDRTLFVHHDGSPARAFTDGITLAMLDHPGEYHEGAWCYLIPHQGWREGDAPRFGADENDID